MCSVSLALFAAVVAAFTVLCSSSVTRLSGFFLVVYPSPRRVADARSYCRSDCATPSNDKANHLGGYLGWILTEEENDEVMSLIYEQAVSVVPSDGLSCFVNQQNTSLHQIIFSTKLPHSNNLLLIVCNPHIIRAPWE
jgi:hypothetical protein